MKKAPSRYVGGYETSEDDGRSFGAYGNDASLSSADE